MHSSRQDHGMPCVHFSGDVLVLQQMLIVFVLMSFPVSAERGTETPRPFDDDPLRFAGEIAAIVHWDAKNSHPEDAILFVGSSSIRMWETASAFPDLTVINRGFGGAQISDVLFYFDQVVAPFAPQQIVFYCGDNDIAAGKSAEQVLGDYQDFVSRVEADFGQIPIVYLPIKPSLMRWALWPEMYRANQLIADYCDSSEHLYRVATDSALLSGEGLPDSSVFVEDGLHLNQEGYRRWKVLVEPVLTQISAAN
jgi:lysophospholipase L1-like esterase